MEKLFETTNMAVLSIVLIKECHIPYRCYWLLENENSKYICTSPKHFFTCPYIFTKIRHRYHSWLTNVVICLCRLALLKIRILDLWLKPLWQDVFIARDVLGTVYAFRVTFLLVALMQSWLSELAIWFLFNN
jgi:hypothetical protein